MRRRTRSRRGTRQNRPLANNSFPRLLSGVDDVVTVPGKALVSVSTDAGSIGTLPLEISDIDGRLTTLGLTFTEFRFIEITVRIHPNSGTTVCLGYFKAPPLNPPTTLALVYGATSSKLIQITETVPQNLFLSKRELLGGLRTWWNTEPASTSDSPLDYTQGIFYAYGPASSSIEVEFGYRIQFRGQVSPALE